MRKVATITFHWATNFGAVLQAYALQNCIKSLGFSTEIIDYVPRRVKVLQVVKQLKNIDINSFKKELMLAKFRKRHLIVSNRFASHAALKRCSNAYEAIICGSDQVWNQGFTLNGEGGPTLSYFLDFAGENTRKIAYAISFGTDKVSDRYINITREYISKFYNISVRENSGAEILKSFDINAPVICDPTVLLDRQKYYDLLTGFKGTKRDAYIYILHRDQLLSSKVAEFVTKYYDENNISQCNDILQWLYYINNAKCVVTNSFHGIMLSIILNTPFIALPVNGSNMNDRIVTVLSRLGLLDRYLTEYNEDRLREILKESIEWEAINEKLAEMREEGKEFIFKSLSTL